MSIGDEESATMKFQKFLIRMFGLIIIIGVTPINIALFGFEHLWLYVNFAIGFLLIVNPNCLIKIFDYFDNIL